MNQQEEILVVGGGLAGCEAAWQLARMGLKVCLVEMRPLRPTPVHQGDTLAQLVCSNSLRGDNLGNAVGLLKAEMEILDSLIIRTARENAVPAGGALAVDRSSFPAAVTAALEGKEGIRIERREIETLPEGPAILATGPLTSPGLHTALEELLGENSLSFFDALAPVISDDSLDHDILFRASRYDKGESADYLNIPLDREQYEDFLRELLIGEQVEFKDFEKEDMHYFEGCLPIEIMARRGLDTLRFGPMKPVGLIDPATGERPWAVIQLRQDDAAARQWNMVGFQTKLTRPEQLRVFRMLPGMEKARFVRYGMIHRNTFIRAPAHLDPHLRLRQRPALRVAGQLSGVEGYVESAAMGLWAARSLAGELRGIEIEPPSGAVGGLIRHLIKSNSEHFQPSNINWGLIPCPEELRHIRRRKERRESLSTYFLEKLRERVRNSSI